MQASIDFSNLKSLVTSFNQTGFQSTNASDQAFSAIFAARAEEVINRTKFAQSDTSRTFEPTKAAWEKPVAALRRSLEKYTDDSGDVVVEPERRQDLEDLLTGLGMSQQRADEVIDQATRDDGRISMGKIVSAVAKMRQENADDSGLTLPAGSLPQMLVLLKKMGLSEDQVNQISDRLGQGEVSLKDLAALLADMSPQGQSTMTAADIAELGDLLVEAGANPAAVQKMLTRYVDPATGQLDLNGLSSLLSEAAGEGDAGLKLALGGNMNQLLAKVMQGAKVVDQSGQTDEAKTAGLQHELNVLKSREGLLPEVAKMEGLEKRLKNATSGQSSSESASTKTGEQAAVQAGHAVKADPLAALLTEEKLKAMFGEELDFNRTAGAQVGKQAEQGGSTQAQSASTAGADNASAAKSTATLGPAALKAQEAVKAQSVVPKAAVARSQPSVLLNQLGGRMLLMIKGGQSSVKMQLNPPELGNLRIDLQVEGNSVRATVVAENHAVQQVVGASGSELRQSLADQGFNLDQFEVVVQDQEREAGSGGDREEGDRDGLAAGSAGEGEAVAEGAASLIARGLGGGRVNLMA